MALSYIWVSFFMVAFIIAFIKWAFYHDQTIFVTLVDGVFKAANDGFDISLKLVGIMALFLGFMKIGEKAGAINFLSRIVGPFFAKLFPELPRNHPAIGQMMMNFSANLLGLDNAATPFGLKAMDSLQELNPDKETASNSQIMFLCLHASGLTLIPISTIAIRAAAVPRPADPTDVFIPCMIVTFVSTIASMIVVSTKQKIRLLQPVIIGWVVGISLLMGLLIAYLSALGKEQLEQTAKLISNGIILLIFLLFLLGALWKRINIFEAFVDGAKAGFEVAVRIIPYLIGMLIAISMLRNSGVFGYIIDGLSEFFSALGVNTDFVPALPTGLMKPLSGAGARGMMVDAMTTYGPDSFVARLSGIFQGVTDTTFYVVAVYFGAVSVKNTRYCIPVMLLADLVGLITAIVTAYMFWG
jgi:spore maturation protein SpmA